MPEGVLGSLGNRSWDAHFDAMEDRIRALEALAPPPVGPAVPTTPVVTQDFVATEIVVAKIGGDPSFSAGGVAFGVGFEVTKDEGQGLGNVNLSDLQAQGYLIDPTLLAGDQIVRDTNEGPPVRRSIGNNGEIWQTVAQLPQWSRAQIPIWLPCSVGRRTGGATLKQLSAIDADIEGEATEFPDAATSAHWWHLPIPRYLTTTDMEVRLWYCDSTPAAAASANTFTLVCKLLGLAADSDMDGVTGASYGSNSPSVSQTNKRFSRLTYATFTVANFGGWDGSLYGWLMIERDGTGDSCNDALTVLGVEILPKVYMGA